MSLKKGKTAVCGSSILCWMTWRRSLVAANRTVVPLAVVSILLVWSGWRNILVTTAICYHLLSFVVTHTCGIVSEILTAGLRTSLQVTVKAVCKCQLGWSIHTYTYIKMIICSCVSCRACDSMGMIKNEQLQQALFVSLLWSLKSCSSQYIFLWTVGSPSVHKSILTLSTYVCWVQQKHWIKGSEILYVRMCSNSIKSGLSLYCDAWHMNSASNVHDDHWSSYIQSTHRYVSKQVCRSIQCWYIFMWRYTTCFLYKAIIVCTYIWNKRK